MGADMVEEVAEDMATEAAAKDVLTEARAHGCVIEIKGKKVAVNAVSISAGATIPTIQYGNIKLSAMITLSALEKDTNLEDMTEFGWDYVSRQMAAQAQSLKTKFGK